ncbi:biofilm formation regulator HmsP [Jejubacter calystegiae]|uniref:Biofilm formation regulator HmsP n=1 Tax=Jejubacter calystegiae TaxID=2579935 RepID=A0A4V1G7A1_9ENTR|nr:biofilm formation regulator HmsP [Jejubacter calystegiae]QCT18927.1 biofilm formation regulator HmsP [Jejubacter calystegiae]
MRVRRSLTIKQMAMVAVVAVAFIFVFAVIQLFHFVQQSRYTTAAQMESIAHSVRNPLSSAILRADIPQAEEILKDIQPVGVISRADVVLPNQFQALRVSFAPERSVPMLISRLFELPVQISLPLYSLERPANPQPLAYLVLQADSWRMYKFIISTLSTLITTWLLLALVLTVAITWCINRLIVHPLRDIARELDGLSPGEAAEHQLTLSRLHNDDEIGMLVRSYNRNQQQVRRAQEEMSQLATHIPVTGLPNKALLLALLRGQEEQSIAPLLMISCETLQEAAEALNEQQREILLLSMVARIQAELGPSMVLAQISHFDFAILANGISESWQAASLAKRLLTALNEKLPVQKIPLYPAASIGIAIWAPGVNGEQHYQRMVSAVYSARRLGKNQIQFFDPQQLAVAQQRMTEQHDILQSLENGEFALWLQPQVDLASGEVVSAEALLRQRQPDGDFALPEGLIERIERCGMMARVGDWILEESCRLLAEWQSQGVTLTLSVNVSALQLLNDDLRHRFMALLTRWRIHPGSLILEVTESQRIDNPQKVHDILRPLRSLGVRIAIDDFGMGYASLHQLQQIKGLPVDILKIDKSFIDALPEDDSMVAVILSLAKHLNMKVVAEGVETPAQRDWLRQAGADIGQGFLFDKALPPHRFMALYCEPARQLPKSP